MYVLDTNAVIYYLKDDPQAVSVLERIFAQDPPIYVSTITEAELKRSFLPFRSSPLIPILPELRVSYGENTVSKLPIV